MDLCITLSMISLLPEEVLIDIIARVPRCYYLTISLVSKHLRSLVASPELYARRSLLGCTEHCVYLLLYCIYTGDYRWYTLIRKANISRLVLIPSLSPMSPHGRFVSMGSSIYMVRDSSYVLHIDCRSHTLKPIFSIPMSDFPVGNTVACVMDKLYLIGSREGHVYSKKRECGLKVMVFDTETQMWDLETTKPYMEGHFVPYSCVLIGDKMYISGNNSTLVYEPKESKLEIEKTLFFPKSEVRHHSEKLDENVEIWRVEITMERHKDGEIWGKTQWCDVVLKGGFEIARTLVVTV